MFIKILFNNQGKWTHGECVVRANGPDTVSEEEDKLSNLPSKKR
jgi:hypothetical protein